MGTNKPLTVILASLLIVQASLLIQDASATEHSSKVVIVGAGASGIAAAALLMENGVNDIVILEAENRIGGRIKSVEIGDQWVDMGAEWIHGRQNNLVYDLVKDYNITQDAKMTFDLYQSNGQRIDKEVAEALWKIVIDFLVEEDKGHKDLTMDKAFEDSYNKKINEKWANDQTNLDIAKKAYDLFVKCIRSYEGSYKLSDATVSSHYEDLDGDDSVWVGHPYKILLDILMKKFPDPSKDLHVTEKIMLKKEVTKIDRNTDKILVECGDGTKYKADFVIFTASLGVLKQNYKTMFEPQLPEEKQKVIEALGFGGVAKIILKFNEAWWPADTHSGLALIWSPEDTQKAKTEFPRGIIEGTDKTWLESLIGFFVVPQYKADTKVLTAWVSGEAVKHVEKLTEEEIIDGCMYMLKTFILPKTHKTEVPRPEKVKITDWYKNKHFRGSYSYDSVKSAKLNVTNGDLGAPVGKLLFAGESTCPTYYSTVHGAVMTGRREARRILKEIKA